MDIDMPIRDGYETTKDILAFQKSHRTQSTIIACTSYVGMNERKRAFEVGMKHYITKPISKQKIKEILEKYNLI